VADQLRLPLYLETCGERNVAIYTKHGYRIAEEVELAAKNDPDGEVPTKVALMIRDPLKPDRLKVGSGLPVETQS